MNLRLLKICNFLISSVTAGHNKPFTVPQKQIYLDISCNNKSLVTSIKCQILQAGLVSFTQHNWMVTMRFTCSFLYISEGGPHLTSLREATGRSGGEDVPYSIIPLDRVAKLFFPYPQPTLALYSTTHNSPHTVQ
jgi:hypothetical protein